MELADVGREKVRCSDRHVMGMAQFLSFFRA